MAAPYTGPRRPPASCRAGSAARAAAGLALTACALAACGDGPETSRPAPSSPAPSSPAPSSPAPSASVPGDPAGDRLVLRVRRTGGIAGLGGPGSVPDLSVYASGRVVHASEPRDPGRTAAEPTEHRLTPQALRRLLDGARAAGFDRSHTVGSDRIADAIITVVALGEARTRIVQPGPPGTPETAFLERLHPDGWSASDQAAPPRPYRPETTAVLAGEVAGTGTGGARAWPLGPLGDGVRAAGGICTLAPSAKVPETRPGVLWRSEGKTYSVRLRPLLPGESSCEDVETSP